MAPCVVSSWTGRCLRVTLVRYRKLSNDEILARLRDLLKRHGRLSALLIDEAAPGPSLDFFYGVAELVHIEEAA